MLIGNFLVKIFGPGISVFYGDPAVFDRYRWLKKNLIVGPQRTLDAGCGSGAFTLYAAKKGNQVTGISFDKRNNRVAVERAKILGITNANFIDGDLRKLDELAEFLGKFDQIICLETIEHILNDKKLLRDFAFLLKPGGHLLLTTPYKCYKHLWRDVISQAGQEDGGHVRWGYTFQEIRDLTRDFGFKIESEEYISGFISQKLINFLRITGAIHPILGRAGGVIIWPLRTVQIFDPLLTRLINYPFLSIAVVARKTF